MSKYITDADLLDAARDYLNTFGFVNYAAIGRRLFCTRQTVHGRLKRLHQEGKLTEEEYNQLRPPSNTRSLEETAAPLKISFSPDNDAFLNNIAERLNLCKSQIVETALTRYRQATDAQFQAEINQKDKLPNYNPDQLSISYT